MNPFDDGEKTDHQSGVPNGQQTIAVDPSAPTDQILQPRTASTNPFDDDFESADGLQPATGGLPEGLIAGTEQHTKASDDQRAQASIVPFLRPQLQTDSGLPSAEHSADSGSRLKAPQDTEEPQLPGDAESRWEQMSRTS
jgi:hypothetical protein